MVYAKVKAKVYYKELTIKIYLRKIWGIKWLVDLYCRKKEGNKHIQWQQGNPGRKLRVKLSYKVKAKVKAKL